MLWSRRKYVKTSPRNHHVGRFDVNISKEIERVINTMGVGDGIYGGPGSLSGATTVDGDGNALSFTNIVGFSVTSTTGLTLGSTTAMLLQSTGSQITIDPATKLIILDSNASQGAAGMFLGGDATGNATWQYEMAVLPISAGNLTSDITEDTEVGYVEVPYDCTILQVWASVIEAPTGSGITMDMNLEGVSILSTPITIDATERRSKLAAVQPVLSTTTADEGDFITIDIDAKGSTNPGKGPIGYLLIQKR